MSEFDIKLYAESCVRADHPHDLKNFKEIFERGEYCRRRYLGNNHLDFGTGVFQDAVVLCCGSYVGFFAIDTRSTCVTTCERATTLLLVRRV